MPNTRDILDQIKSVTNTQKITKAMEMVAASKMRKSQDLMQKSRPYFQKIHQVIRHVAHSHSEYRHPYLIQRTVKKIGLLIISSDRGLCGGLNHNLFKDALVTIQQAQQQGHEVELYLVGKKAESYFNKFALKIVAVEHGFSNMVSASGIVGLTQVILERFDDNQVDQIVVMYNKFINTMSQHPTNFQLLPLLPAISDDYNGYWDYLYEGEATALLDDLLDRYIESSIYQAIVENIACEQSARMVSMKSATDNAGELINKFKLSYNKARQASITQEIAEIVGGAAAV